MTGKFRLFRNNRLYCTFTTADEYEEVANTIQTSYVILCSESELNISYESEGIIELNQNYKNHYDVHKKE